MAQGNAIPTRSRELVRERDNGQCSRCGVGGPIHLHHRRRRAVKRGHDNHCACNLVSLCPADHAWAHANPAKARETGYIIRESEAEPWTVPLKIYGTYWAVNDCHGEFDFVPNGDKTE